MQTERIALNFDHLEIMRTILAGIIETGDASGRAVLAVAVDDWLMDELTAVGAEMRWTTVQASTEAEQ